MTSVTRLARNLCLGRSVCSPGTVDSLLDGHGQGYQRAELITSDELALIKRVDRQSRVKFESILVTEGRQYALLFLNLLMKLARADTMQNILVLIGDALTG